MGVKITGPQGVGHLAQWSKPRIFGFAPSKGINFETT